MSKMTTTEIKKKIKQERLQKSRTVLAKLLAAENVQVTFDSDAKTASFQTEERILTLPTLKDMETYHYDGYVAHEVAHALYTPPLKEKDYEELEKEVPFSFVNITEDARIEKLMQNKFVGLRKDFYDMYKDFSSPERNMFEIEGKDLSQLSTIDKINLFFKIGKFVTVPFRQEEKIFVDKVAKTKTFDDAVKVAKEIYEFMKQDPNQPKSDKNQGGGNGKGQNSQNGGNPSKNGKPTDADGNGDTAGYTQKAFEKNRQKMMEANDKSEKIQYGEAIDSGDLDIDDIVRMDAIKRLKRAPISVEQCDSFLRQVKPTVNMMVAQFNMRKSASEWNKTREAKTGRLNMRQIAKYKVNKNIFKNNEIVFEEKNHGMVMVIDWSASMNNVIHNTVKQLITMLEFCNRLQIPYEVYGFTDGGNIQPNKGTSKDKIRGQTNTSIFKMIDSTCKKNDYKNIITNMFLHSKNNPSEIFSMSGTPLQTTGLMMDIIVEKFKEKYRREKVIMVLLSDGESSNELYKNGNGNQRGKVVITDKYTAKNYVVENFHDVFRYVKDRNKISSLIGIYITPSLQPHSINSTFCPEFSGDTSKHVKEFGQKHYTVFDQGKAFDKFFVININQFDFKNTAQKNYDSMSKYTSLKDKIKKIDDIISSSTKPMIFMKILIDEIA